MMDERLLQVLTLLAATTKWLSGRRIAGTLGWPKRGPDSPNRLLYWFRPWFRRAMDNNTPVWQLSESLRQGIAPAEGPPESAQLDLS